MALMVRESLTGERAARNAATPGRSVAPLDRGQGRARELDKLAGADCATRPPSPASPAISSPPSTWPTSWARIPTSRATRQEDGEDTDSGESDEGARTSSRRRPPKSQQDARQRCRIRPGDGRRRRDRQRRCAGRSRRRGTTAEARNPGGPQLPFSSPTNDDFYKVYTNQFDEEIAAEDLCDAEELTRLRNFLDQQLANLAGRGLAPRQPPAAPADGAAEPLVGLRSRGRHARCRAPHPRHHRSHASAVLQGGAGHRVPRHRA